MPFEQAVTLVFGGITARGYLNQVTMKPGDSVLVNGAAGAVGTAMVQLAKELGARVTGVTSDANRGLVTSLGAERVIDYTSEDFTGTSHPMRGSSRGRASLQNAICAPGYVTWAGSEF